MIADLESTQEVLEEEIESSALAESLNHADLQLQILKLEAALNLTVSHAAELRAGHSALANRTLALLASVVELARTTAPPPDTSTIDGVEVTPAPAPSPAPAPGPAPQDQPRFRNCSEVTKIAPAEVTCTASSQFSRKFGCKKAFDGHLSIGKQRNSWASAGEGVGAWIEARFVDKERQPVVKVIHQLKLLQRHFPGEANKKVEIQFGEGGPRQVATLPARGDKHWNIIKLSSGVVADRVRVTVREVYGTVNNGFKEIVMFGCNL